MQRAKFSETALLTLDLFGTFVFAVEGALAAVQGNLDLLGLMVLAFATALGGGIIRDLLIDAAPPNAIRDWRYGAIAFAGGGAVFFLYEVVRQVPTPLIITADAAGLALFAVSGTGKALAYGIQPFIAILMGGITGVGGGTIRDVLLAQVPAVLRVDIYAAAALLGSAVMVTLLRLGAPRGATAITGGIVCFALRMVAVWQHWNLPTVRH